MGTLDEVAKTTIKLMVREPFYGHFFLSVLKREGDEGSTIGLGVGGEHTISLFVGPRYWKETLHTQALRYGAIKHQVLHLVFKHVLESQKYGDARLFDIAADLVVNQYLLDTQRPDNACLISDFPGLALAPHMDVGYYYRRLSALREEGVGSDAALLAARMQAGSSDDHGGWSAFGGMSDGVRSIFDGELNRLIVSSAERAEKTVGHLPAHLQTQIDTVRALLQAQVPWKRVLRLFSSSSRRTSIRNTIRRPSKRYGTTPGIKIVRHQKVLVAVDTSGSVDAKELQAFFGEIHRIYKQGAEVLVVECDAEIGDIYRYTGHPPKSVSGRGGTCFDAPIRYSNTEYVPDAVIYFTDGCAPTPQTKSRKPLLWVISSDGIDEQSKEYAALPGMKVKMSPRSKSVAV